MNTKNNIKERIIEFLAYLDIGQGKFEKNCGISNGTVNNIKDGVSSPNIYKIVKRYPELNLDWLITGEGEMLKQEKENHPILESKKLIQELKEENKDLREENIWLKGQNSLLREQLGLGERKDYSDKETLGKARSVS